MEKDDFEIAYELFLKKEDLNHSKNNLSRFCTIWNTQLTLYQIKAKDLATKFKNKNYIVRADVFETTKK